MYGNLFRNGDILMQSKEKYRQLCTIEKDIPLFSQDWWMDAVCGEENWDVLVVEKDQRIIAALPYYLKKKIFLRCIVQPPFTTTHGIWLKYPPGQKYVQKLSYEREVISNIIKQIDDLRVHVFMQDFHYSFTNWLPFAWNNFKQTNRYTYILEDLTNLASVFDSFKPAIRAEIRKAARRVTINEDCELETLYKLLQKSYERQKLPIPYKFEQLLRLDQVCRERKCRKILFAVDEQKNIHTACYFVWDETYVYYLLAGTDRLWRNSGANSLLVWEAIKMTAAMAKKFNFDGSSLEPIERFVSSFGGRQKPCFRIYRSKLLHTDLWDLYQHINKLKSMLFYYCRMPQGQNVNQREDNEVIL